LQVGQSVTFCIAGAYAETSYSYLQVWKSRNKAPLKIVTINNGLQAVVTREEQNYPTTKLKYYGKKFQHHKRDCIRSVYSGIALRCTIQLGAFDFRSLCRELVCGGSE
jgi:hypothetical protein